LLVVAGGSKKAVGWLPSGSGKGAGVFDHGPAVKFAAVTAFTVKFI
jgi:hypothetical protein